MYIKDLSPITLKSHKTLQSADRRPMIGRSSADCTYSRIYSLRSCAQFAPGCRVQINLHHLEGRSKFAPKFAPGCKFLKHPGANCAHDLYEDMFSCVRSQGFTSDWFPVKQGTRQGGCLSPFFILFMAMTYLMN